MNLSTWVGLAVLGGIGATARFLIDGAIGSWWASSFPLGTLAVNLVGSLALAVLAGAAVGEDVLSLTATGALGSFTTFSTWMFETQRLVEDDELGLASTNLLVSLVLGVAAAWLGLEIGATL